MKANKSFDSFSVWRFMREDSVEKFDLLTYLRLTDNEKVVYQVVEVLLDSTFD